MIVPMARVRVLGPREALPSALEALQDAGLLHPCAAAPRLEPAEPLEPAAARRRALRATCAEVVAALEALGPTDPGAEEPAALEPGPEQGRRERAEDARSLAEELRARIAAGRSELSRLRAQQELITAFAPVLERTPGLPLAAFQVVLRPGEEDAAGPLGEALSRAIGDEYSLHRCRLSAGGQALLILVGRSVAERVESLLVRAGVQESAVAREYGRTLLEALPRMRERLAELPGELEELAAARRDLRRRLAPGLRAARLALEDELARLDAASLARRTGRVFVLEGWLPEAAVPRLRGQLERRDGRFVVELLSEQEWRTAEAPVVLRNPRLFRPFEAVTKLLPLPVYGTIDPTPYVAVFFPMFFGLMLGDVALGGGLALLALVLRLRSSPGGVLRSVSEIAGACALFSIVFGLLYGELLGDLGHRLLGMEPALFRREEALVPFLVLALGLGLVHVLLGLVLAGVSALRGRHDRREAAGAGLQLLLVLLVVLGLLAALEVLPRALLTPATITLLVLFPVFVLVEGILAPLRLLSTLSHVLSYARIMAIGTASVMLAVVANRLAGALGGALVGVVFALLFHLVNFALGIFGPALHGLRLHWVEFFGEFYSPGGLRYAPLRHGAPLAGAPGGVS